MADLKLEVAQNLVGALLNIGHPRQQSSVNATAMFLIKWCTGAIVSGTVWSPERQAQALVDEACETWPDGWPDKGGTKQLLDLYRAKFKPARSSTFVELTPEEKAAFRAAEAAMCAGCHGFGTRRVNGQVEFCSCEGGKLFAVECGGQGWLDRVNRKASPQDAPKPYIDLEQLISRAQANHDDEKRRKQEQLQRVGCD